jgi:hypothetical protein
MKHYFSLHGIIDDIVKLQVGVCFWIRGDGNDGNDIINLMDATMLGPSL